MLNEFNRNYYDCNDMQPTPMSAKDKIIKELDIYNHWQVVEFFEINLWQD